MNKIRATCLFVALAVCAGALPWRDALAITLMPLMKSQKDLEGNWLGGEMDRELARLTINADGTGSLRVQWMAQSPVHRYRVTRARLQGGAIDFVVVPEGKNPPVTVIAGASMGQITLELKPVQGEWRTKLQLWREDTVLSRIRAVTK